MQSKLRTAKEFMNDPENQYYTVEGLMIKFAQMHRDAILETAYSKAEIIDDPNSYTGNTGSEYPPDQIIDKQSILRAYPDELIK